MPETAPELTDQAALLHRSGRLDEAERLYLAALAADGREVRALHYLGVLRAQQGRLDEALERIEAALALAPDDAEALFNRANVLKSVGRADEALAGYTRALALKPGWPQAQNNRGTALQALHRFDEALEAYDGALAAGPNPEALNNRGSVLEDLGRPEEALAAYDQALTLAPGFAAAVNNRGSALLALNRFAEALAAFDRAITLSPQDAKAHNNRGNALLALGRAEEALAAYDRALGLKPGDPQTLNNRGQALQELKRPEEALASFEEAGSPEAFAGAAMAARDLCDWTRTARIGPELERRVRAGQMVPPWVLLGYSEDEMLQRACAEKAIAARFPALPPPLAAAPYRHERIRLAYVSSDMGQHPVAALSIELLESHDRSAFEVTGIATSRDDGSALRKRMENAFEHFIDASAMAPAALAAELRRREVDILVDLNGHTRGDSFVLLSHRPAPVQASWLGYPGAIAAPFVDWLIADPVIAPDPDAFPEKLAMLPRCFFPGDGGRAAGPAPSRAEAGLPETAFVFCSFNNSWKITEPVFALWMRLLAQIPDSVLWLKEARGRTRDNLLSAAQSAGIAPQRLVFARPAPLDVHLARHQLADLFLDTAPYGAHATASDALYAGLPVLTRRGHAVASRIAASLLTAANLAELIAEHWEGYEALALALARDPVGLKALRERLAAGRTQLFDTPRLVRELEALYRTMLAA